MKVNRKILAIIGCVTMMTGIVGCMPKPGELYKKEMSKAIEYLEEKYGGNFIEKGYEVADYLSTTDVVFCYEENMNPEEENVKVFIQRENGKVVYSDNYFGYIIRPEVEEWVTEIVKTEFDDVKVYMSNNQSVFPDTLTRENNLEDLYELIPGYLISAYVYVKGDKNILQEEYDKKTKKLEKILKKTEKSFRIRIYVISGEVYEKVGRYEQNQFFDLFPALPEANGEECFYIYHKQMLQGD